METSPTRDLAIKFTRGRAVLGLGLAVVPGLLGRAWLGRDGATPAARAGLRMLGARDIVLGVGALTAIKERGPGPEWLGMSAVADGVDAAVCLLTPKLGWRARVVGIVAAVAAIVGMLLARDLADEAEAARLAEEEARNVAPAASGPQAAGVEGTGAVSASS